MELCVAPLFLVSGGCGWLVAQRLRRAKAYRGLSKTLSWVVADWKEIRKIWGRLTGVFWRLVLIQ